MFYNHETWASQIGSETAACIFDSHLKKNADLRETCFFPAIYLGVNYAPRKIRSATSLCLL